MVIKLTRLGGRPFYLNSDLIESLESTPDTTILLTSGKRLIVQESADEVVRRVTLFRRLIAQPLGSGTREALGASTWEPAGEDALQESDGLPTMRTAGVGDLGQ